MLLALLTLAASQAPGELRFERVVLSDEFLCEGAAIGDLDGDGAADVVAGPWWYRGPDFARREAFYEPRAVDPLGYSDHFFDWIDDVDGDGDADVVSVGFPGRAAWWHENPGGERLAQGARWTRHEACTGVGNEAPAYADVDGDGRRDLVYTSGGSVVWATPDAADPRAPWRVRPIGGGLDPGPFHHGLGVGDVDGDGRADVLDRGGVWLQPDALDGDPAWERVAVDFASGRRGGAQMGVYDVDGDGDADVVTSLDAHGWGLSWFEQTDGLAFREHRIMDDDPAQSHGVAFSQLHALAFEDMDGDGLTDVVTGKRWWAHGPKGDPQPGAAPVVAWLRLVRDADGARFEPQVIDADSGVGTQLAVGDLDGDGRPDVATANKRGAFLLLRRAGEGGGGERTEPVPTSAAERAQGAAPVGDDGAPLDLGLESGTLDGWTATGTAFDRQPCRGDTVAARREQKSAHAGEHWIGTYEHFGDEPTGTLTSRPFAVTHPWASFLVGGGQHDSTRVEIVRARDGAVLSSTSGRDHEELQPVAVDLREHAGERVFVRLVDEHTGHWGHVNYDDFRFHAQEPRFPSRGPLPLDVVPHEGLAPSEAAAAMSVPPGFRVELIASEPDLHQPIALAIDDRGRLWVAEAHSYPQKRPAGEGRDRILILEDRGGDGTFETRKVFAEGLNLVSGLAVGFGGVFVGAAPELLFFADADGDDRPDGEPQVLLDGWGYQDTHETLNAFTWGPDGWLYGCHGVFTHSRVGAPGTPDTERVPLNAAVWRYHPSRRDFEVFAWGTSNPWGIDFDERGQAFITACVIPHLWHVVQGARYVRQAGSHFDPHVYAEIGTIADHQHFVGETPWSGNLRSGAAGGGHAHCGAMLYLGDAFPPAYRGTLFVNNVHGNRVNNEALAREGSGFVGSHRPDFLNANDAWFRGIALESGPSGSVYLIDWYDPRACHSTDVDAWDRGNGRLYRVSYGEHVARRVDLAARSDDELVDLLWSDDAWHARHAQRLLQERGGSDAVRARLVATLREDPRAKRKLRALWALHVTGGLGDVRDEALESPYEDVRAWAVQLSLERAAPAELVAKLEQMARVDPSPVVRLYLASALQRIETASRWGLAAALAARTEDRRDRNVPYLSWYGFAPLVALDAPRALALAGASGDLRLVRFCARRAAAAGDAGNGAGTSAVLAALEGADERSACALLEGLADSLRGRRVPMPAAWPAAHDAACARLGDAVRGPALEVALLFGDERFAEEHRALLFDPAASRDRRLRALEALVRLREAGEAARLRSLAGDARVGADVIAALASFEDDGATAAALLAQYGSLGAEARRAAIGTLVARPLWARALLEGVERGDVPRADVNANALRQMRRLGDDEVERRLARGWDHARATPAERRAEIERRIAQLDAATLAEAHLPRGRALFESTCGSCHALFGSGGAIGPDLTGANRGDLEYLLANMVDPNALIPAEYRTTEVWTRDGRVLAGLLREETDSALTLENELETVVVAQDDVDERRLSELSMMPEGQLALLAPDEVRDLVAYLRSPAQTPVLAGPGDEERLFDGVTLAGWSAPSGAWSVEDGVIVGRAPQGLARNDFLASELWLEDFRLVVDVLLEPNTANSGIQFRSRAQRGGDVAGYQADVGAGWWGKLYEEHGRGLLVTPDDPLVRPGEWNRYEILARGARVRTALNGRPCVDWTDPTGVRGGVIALQIHSGGPTEVRFRDLRLEIDPGPELTTVAQ